jgi:hypothetical protein
LWFKASTDKKSVRSLSTDKKLGVVVHACYPSYKGNINRRIAVQAYPGINTRSCLEKYQSKERWDSAQVEKYLASQRP